MSKALIDDLYNGLNTSDGKKVKEMFQNKLCSELYEIDSDLNTSNTGIKARLSTVESDLNTPTTGVKARVTTLESQIADENLVKIYNTVSEMQLDSSNLLLNNVTETLGYTTKGDKLGRKYIVKTDDDGTNLPCGTGLWFNKFSDEYLEKGGYQGTAQDLSDKIDTNTTVQTSKQLLATGESGHFGVFDYTNLNKDKYSLFSSGSSGWACPNNVTSANVKFRFKNAYGVVIGDSISEGKQSLSGGLTQSPVDLTYQSQVGQYAYHLMQGFRIPFYNHGIAGDTSQGVRNRWNRDVLAQDVSGLTPTRTIQADMGLPLVVFIHVGVNDLSAQTAQTVKDNLLFMAQSCKDNGIYCIMDTIGGYTGATSDVGTKMNDVNNFIKTTIKSMGVIVHDYYDFTSTAYNQPKADIVSDNIHPKPHVYFELAQRVIKLSKKLPIFAKKLRLYTYEDSGASGTEKIKTIAINDSDDTNIKSKSLTSGIIDLDLKNIKLQAYNDNYIYLKNITLGNIVSIARIELELSNYDGLSNDTKDSISYTTVFGSQFSNYGSGFESLGVYKEGNTLKFKGLVKANSQITTSATIFTIQNFSIPNSKYFNIQVKVGGVWKTGWLTLSTNGTIVVSYGDTGNIDANSFISFDNLNLNL